MKVHRILKRSALLILTLALIFSMIPVALASGLKEGDKNDNVLKVQKQLSSLGYYDGKKDGVFREDLKHAVKHFQNANGLKVTGEVNGETRKALDGGKAITRTEYDKRRALKSGDSGDAVKHLQKQLKDLGYYDGKIDGKYGSAVEKAVAAMQKANDLKATGNADEKTRKLLNVGKPKKATAATAAPAATPAPSAAPTATAKQASATLGKGDSGEAVKTLQKKLKDLHFYTGKINGKFDKNTYEAVKELQSCNGLKSSGKLDEATHKLLSAGNAVSKRDYDFTLPVKKGDSGDAVKALQVQLRDLKYFTGKTSGRFGQATYEAVREFQSANGLTVTGKADANTRAKLNSSSAIPKGAKPTPTPTPAPAQPTPTPKPAATSAATAQSAAPVGSKAADRIETVISAAKKQLGKPYIFASAGMKGFDCSGLTVYAFKQASISLPRTAHLQGYQNLTRLKKSELKRGDLVCFNTRSGVASLSNHVGIYLGNDEYIHASSSQKKVVISKLSGYSKFSWGLRLIK